MWTPVATAILTGAGVTTVVDAMLDGRDVVPRPYVL